MEEKKTLQLESSRSIGLTSASAITGLGAFSCARKPRVSNLDHLQYQLLDWCIEQETSPLTLTIMYQLLPWSLQLLLGHFLWTQPAPPPARPMTFTLRHQHSVAQGSRVIFSDNLGSHNGFSSGAFTINTKPITAHRPTSFDAHSAARRRSMRFGQTDSGLWNEVTIPGPDVMDRETLLTLAKMTNNAYYERNDTGWYELGDKWNTVRHIWTSPNQRYDLLTVEKRVNLSAGNPMQMVSEATSSSPTTTLPSSYP